MGKITCTIVGILLFVCNLCAQQNALVQAGKCYKKGKVHQQVTQLMAVINISGAGYPTAASAQKTNTNTCVRGLSWYSGGSNKGAF